MHHMVYSDKPFAQAAKVIAADMRLNMTQPFRPSA